MTTHKTLVEEAKTILAAYLEKDASLVAESQKEGCTPKIFKDIAENVSQTLSTLIYLFDGPRQREADATAPLTLNELQKLCCRTLPNAGFQHWFKPKNILSGVSGQKFIMEQGRFDTQIDLLHALLGLSGEVGELVDPVKKSMFYGKPLDVENIKEEAGDILWYIAGPLCSALGCTLEDLARANVAKLRKRYPEKYTDQAAIDRADKQ